MKATVMYKAGDVRIDNVPDARVINPKDALVRVTRACICDEIAGAQAEAVRVIPLFAHPPKIRKVIYTTNAIESLNMSLRKVTKARGSFPNDEAVFKLLFLALRNIAKKWTMPVHDWKAALNRFAIVYENRLPVE